MAKKNTPFAQNLPTETVSTAELTCILASIAGSIDAGQNARFEAMDFTEKLVVICKPLLHPQLGNAGKN